MKKPTPPPCRLAELYDSVLNSLRGMDEDHRSSVIRALAGGLDDPEYRPWGYYCRAEPVPEGLTREAWWCAVRSVRATTARPTPFTMKDNALDLQSSRCSFESE